MSGHLCVLRIIWLWRAQQGLQGDQGSSDRQGWSPLVFEDIQANSPGLGADVWMPYLGIELHLGWFEGVLLGDDDVDLENAALVAGVFLYSQQG